MQCLAAANSIAGLLGGRMSIYRNQLLCGSDGSRGHGIGTLGFSWGAQHMVVDQWQLDQM